MATAYPKEHPIMGERPANADMIEGFRDGYDLNAPDPSDNRSRSYKHGFMCSRIDRHKIDFKGTAADLRRMADDAMRHDEAQ